MEKEFFKTQIQRLKKTYGKESYPEESIKALWFELKHVTENRFFRAVNRIIATYVNPKYPPGIDKIEKVLSEIKEEQYQIEKKENTENANKALRLVTEKSLDTTQINEGLKKISELI